MPTYLLTWNPERWQWNYIQKSIAQIETDGFCFEPWSVGVTKKIHTGDRVFLMKLGEKPRGISASGWVTSDTYEDKHWDDNSKNAFYVDVHFDAIIDPSQEPIFSIELLQDKIYSAVNWTPQASGMSIPDDVAEHPFSPVTITSTICPFVSVLVVKVFDAPFCLLTPPTLKL